MNSSNDNYPFAGLRIHSEDAVWLRKRWDRYCSEAAALAEERAKEIPDPTKVNNHMVSMFQHKKAVCDYMSHIYSRASRRMLHEAFGDDVEEWMREHGIRIVSEQVSKKERDKKY